MRRRSTAFGGLASEAYQSLVKRTSGNCFGTSKRTQLFGTEIVCSSSVLESCANQKGFDHANMCLMMVPRIRFRAPRLR